MLWSCTTCGACVEQCPVDIEHVDHIIDMRRYQTLIESAFPSELGGLFKNLEGKGNPWGMGARARLDWAKDLPFPVKVLGQDVEKASDVEWLFWVGCAGAYEDRAKKTTRAVAELLDTAGVSFAVLGDGETCTGDSARRAGNELLFQTLAAAERRRPSASSASPRSSSPARTASTRSRTSTRRSGGRYEVVHHTQLLNRLVRDKKLVPVARPSDVPGMSSAKNPASTASTVTYHDPCYLGRHNGVYAPPRELIEALPGVELREMERTRETSFCCGAGGARMWMEEKLGTQINTNRTEEAIATGAERIAIGCPFCRVMISDGLTAKQAQGEARVGRGRRRRADAARCGAPWPEPEGSRRRGRGRGRGGDAGRSRSRGHRTSRCGHLQRRQSPVQAPAAVEADPWDEPAAPAAAAAAVAATGRARGRPVGPARSTTTAAARARQQPEPEPTPGTSPQHRAAGPATVSQPTPARTPTPGTSPRAASRRAEQRQGRRCRSHRRRRPLGRAGTIPGDRRQPSRRAPVGRAEHRPLGRAASTGSRRTRPVAEPSPTPVATGRHRATSDARRQSSAAHRHPSDADPWDEPAPSARTRDAVRPLDEPVTDPTADCRQRGRAPPAEPAAGAGSRR